jgi:large subunit ribosomal protein L18e
MLNPEIKNTIKALRSASKKRNEAIWAKLADELDKPKRRRITVNISDINRHSKSGEIVAIPGKVLASGSLGHPVIVAANAFSEMAKKKIEYAEGSAIRLLDLLEGTKPSAIKILK